MNIFQEFFIKFTTNAKEAKKDVSDFGKATADTQQTINRTDDSAKNLGLSFSKLALAGVAALEGFASLGKLKEAIIGVVNYNAEIEKTSKLTGINARELSIWNDVVARAGGNPGSKSYLNFITQLNDKYASLGINDRIKRVNEDLLKYSQKFKELEANKPGSSEPLAAKLGIDHDLWLALTGDIEGAISAEEAFDNTSEKTAKSSLELARSWVDLSVQSRSLFNDLIPLGQLMTAIASVIIKGWSVAAGVIDGVLGTLSGGRIGGWQNFARMLAEDFPGAFPKLETPAAPPDTVSVSPEISKNAPLGIRSNNPGNLRPGGGEAVYPTQAAGLAAEQNLLRKYGSRGINTLAGIISKWAPPNENDTAAYIADAARKTGLNPNQQLDLNDPAVVAKIANAINSHENGWAYGSLIKTAQNSVLAANASPLNSTSNTSQKSLNIGSITIHTQATDANGIAGSLNDSLNQHFATTVGSFDDGIAK